MFHSVESCESRFHGGSTAGLCRFGTPERALGDGYRLTQESFDFRFQLSPRLTNAFVHVALYPARC